MSKNIKDRLMIIKIVNVLIVSTLFLLLLMPLGCVSPKEKKQEESELEFIDACRDNAKREIGMMKDSLKEGLWISLFPDGKVASIEFFESNKWNGPFIIYYENGNILKYMDMKNNINHGKYINYYENGLIQSEMIFVNDTIDGLLKSYTSNGKLEKIWEYNMGKFERTIYGPPPPIIE